MFTKAFWAAVLERMLKTFAQTVIAAAGVTTVDAATLAILHDTWLVDVELGGVAAFLSLATSIASAGVRSNGPSLATETTDVPELQPAVRAQQATGTAADAVTQPDDGADLL